MYEHGRLFGSPEAAWQIQGVQPRKKLNMMLLSAQLCNGACKPSICEVACMRSKAAMTCETVLKACVLVQFSLTCPGTSSDEQE